MAASQDPLAWRRQFCRWQWKEQEGEEDRRRDGKITSRNWQEWSLEIPWGQRKTGNGGTVLLQRHLWCPDDLRGYGTEMRWDERHKSVEEKVGSQSNCLFNRHTTNIATSVDAASKIILRAIIKTLLYCSGLYLYHGQPDRSTSLNV